jgi:hypothetical protein
LQGQNFHHIHDVLAGLLLDAGLYTQHLVVADAELVPDTGEHCYVGHHQSSVLLARPDSIGQHLIADMPITLAGIPLRHCLLSGDGRIIDLNLLVPAARGNTSGMPGTLMQG